jgi:hypothetical protein
MRRASASTTAPPSATETSGAAASRAGIHEFVRTRPGPGVAVLVTHQVNITGAYGAGIRMGEGVVIMPDDGGGEPLGSLDPRSL